MWYSAIIQRLALVSLFILFPAKADILPDRQQIDGWLNNLGGKTALMTANPLIGAFCRGLFIPLKWG